MEKSIKNQLRKEYLEKRDGLNPESRARDSATIRQQLFRQRGWQEAHTIFSYVSFRSEVETHTLIQEALLQKKRVVVPVINNQLNELQLSELKEWNHLVPGAFGILEPSASYRTWVDPLNVDLAVIPGVVFDRHGGRIGMGVGFIDKLLAGMNQAQRIALAYSLQIHTQPIPLEPHDAMMNTLLTEKEVISIS